MAKDSKVVYGASGKTNVLTFEPESLHLVTDKTHWVIFVKGVK